MLSRRTRGRQRGPIDARHGAQRDFRHRHQRAGIAGGNSGSCLPRLHSGNGHGHRTVLLADGNARLVRAIHDRFGVNDFGRRTQMGMVVERRLYARFVAEQGE